MNNIKNNMDEGLMNNAMDGLKAIRLDDIPGPDSTLNGAHLCSAQCTVRDAIRELEMMVAAAVDRAVATWTNRWGQLPVEIRTRSVPIGCYGGNPKHMQCRAEVTLKSDRPKTL